MTDPNTHSDEATVGFDEHHGPGVKAYLVIFAALSAFTLVSFVANRLAQPDETTHQSIITPHQSFVIILGVAIVKATLVGAYFMHLVVDWRKLYYLLIPAFILGTMMMIVLMPDIVLAWRS
jgi:cytochrome c oxidase subunit IV